MSRDDRIFVLTADLGYKMWDNIRRDYPHRFYNVGVSEQLLIGAGIGLAQSGKIPVCFSITPFLLKRPFEWIDNYLEHEHAPVKLLGGGRDKDYHEDGYSHDASNAKSILDIWPHIRQFWPENMEELREDVREWLYCDGPAFLSLKR